ncbi:MAG: pyrroloquinoline quinone biosynthesis protein PqqB [Pseudomonadota bacterium]
MYVRVLGSAAGGGYPQWNCNHPNSRRARQNDPSAPQRTQSSLAVSADGERWLLFNASPDLRQQISDNDILHPKKELRESPIKGALLTNADVDHVAGLLNLRESQPLRLYGSDRVLSVLNANSIFNVLNPDFVARETVELNVETQITEQDGSDMGFAVLPFAVPGKVALWLEDKSKGDNFGTEEGDTIAVEVKQAGKTRFFYIPACAKMTDALAARIRGAEMVFFDGTLWVDDEMVRDGVGVKTGQRMGHMSVSGSDGTMAAFADLEVARKIFIHINTTNPILIEDTDERRAVEQQGWEVSFDGMHIEL